MLAAFSTAPPFCRVPPPASVQKFVSQFVDAHVMPFLPHESAAGGGDEPSAAQGGGSGSGSWGGERSPPPGVHPSGISKAWSMLYVWLQYAQWYKVLCWLLVLVLGGSEGLLPVGLREAFRVEELLLASESRAQTFIFGQCVPFVLTKTRHFLVTWAGHSHVVRLIFYSAFTSHVEVASTLACDSVVAVSDSRRVPPQPPRASPPLLLGLLPPPVPPSLARAHTTCRRLPPPVWPQAHLLYDWFTSAANDYSLRLNLNRLRAGYFAIASLPRTKGQEAAAAGDARDRSGAAQRRGHAGDPE